LVCSSFKIDAFCLLLQKLRLKHSWTPAPCLQLASPLINFPEGGHGVRVWEKNEVPWGTLALPNWH